MIITYEGYLGESSEAVLFSCPDWLNPILPEVEEGYFVRVFDLNDDLTNQASFFLNATSLQPYTLV